MALFVIRHEHAAQRCPAADPAAGATLLNHLSRQHVRDLGVKIRGEAVVRGEHTVYMIVECADVESVRGFMAPFALAGTVEIYPATTCAGVVASGGCEAPVPAVNDVVPALDPEEACQRAIEAGLLVHRAHPLNCETSIAALIGGVVVPNAHFYVRNHFQIPLLDPDIWRLDVGGLASRPMSLGLQDLHRLPSQTLAVTLECAGNGRSRLSPPVSGEQWDLGAVSTAEWTGVPLADVLDRAGVSPHARHVVFRGADGGVLPGQTARVRFERSLTLEDARQCDALLAYGMNGEPLPIQHGYPLRLVVPDWYGVASVKWLTEIEIVDRQFDGHFQTGSYFYERERDGELTRAPVTLQRARALVSEPAAGASLACGEIAIRGVAWSGAAAISRVEVSIGDGPWHEARLVGQSSRHSWQWWELITHINSPGTNSVRARATDVAGNSQPMQPDWNRLGYGNNAVQDVPIHLH